MANEDGTVWITYNGEVYNHVELRAELEARGPPLPLRAPTPRRSSTSTRRRAPRASSACTGMFAFAIWDARRRELLLARDRLGVKPLYYARLAAAASLFGSEVKADPRAPGGAARPRRGGVRLTT